MDKVPQAKAVDSLPSFLASRTNAHTEAGCGLLGSHSSTRSSGYVLDHGDHLNYLPLQSLILCPRGNSRALQKDAGVRCC